MSQIIKLQLGSTLHYDPDKVVDANDFFDSLEQEVESYVASLDWSKKDKERFLQAYRDILSRQVTGMKVIDGVRHTTYEGALILKRFYNKKMQDAYGEAAYFINEQLKKRAYNPEELKRLEEEAAKKKEEERLASLPKFNTGDFEKFFYKTVFGGMDNANIMDWHELDEPDPDTWYRGIEVRRKALASILNEYIAQLPEYNYEGSAFKNLGEYKLKLENARQALLGGNLQDIKMTLNAAGINWRTFLETESLTKESRDKLNYIQANADALLQQLEAVEEGQEVTETPLTEENGEEEDTNEEMSDEEAAIEYGAQETTEKIDEKKVELASMSITQAMEEHPREFWLQVGAIGADLVSLMVKHPIAAGTTGVAAAVMRDIAGRGGSPGDWSERLIDYGTGLLGFVPFLGNESKIAKVSKNISKVANFLGKGFFAYVAATGGPKLAKKLWNGEELNMDDFSTIAQLVLGLVALKRTGDHKIFGKVLQSRGLYKKGNISFRVNKGGKTEKVRVEVDAPYDDPIWELNKKSVDERRRILSENGSVLEYMKKNGIERDLILNKPKVRATRLYVTKPSDTESLNRAADAALESSNRNAGWFGRNVTNRIRSRRRYRAVAQRSANYPYLSLEPVNNPTPVNNPAPVRNEPGTNIPTLKRTYIAPVTQPAKDANPSIFGGTYKRILNPDYNNFYYWRRHVYNPASNKIGVLSNDDFIRLRHETLSKEDIDQILRNAGVFRMGGKIYKNVDDYLYNFIINNN